MPARTEVKRCSATLADGREVVIPYWEITADADGPVFLVIANQHGNEVNGCEAIRRFVEIASSDLERGKVLAVPFANRPALHCRRPHINMRPEQAYSDDRCHNMNRTWPGNPRGNDTERVSHAIYENVARRADLVLDLHSWSRFTATGAIIRENTPELRKLAKAAAIRFVHVSPIPKGTMQKYSTISGWFNNIGKTGFTIELATQYAVVEHEVQRGVRAATNFAKYLGMMDGELEGTDEPVFFLNEVEEVKVTAPCAGLFVESGLAPWDEITKGVKLGHIIKDDTLETVDIIAPAGGYLREYGCRRPDCDVALHAQHPYASEGDQLATIVIPRG